MSTNTSNNQGNTNFSSDLSNQDELKYSPDSTSTSDDLPTININAQIHSDKDSPLFNVHNKLQTRESFQNSHNLHENTQNPQNLKNSFVQLDKYKVFDYCRSGELRQFTELVDKNRNYVNITEPEDRAGSRGSTLLHIAAGFGRHTIVHYLLNKGAECNAKDKGGLAPLHNASCYGHVEIVKILLEHNRVGMMPIEGLEVVDVNSADRWDFTPLHEAAFKNREDCVHLLLQYGANFELVNSEGKKALDLAPEGSVANDMLNGTYRFEEMLEACRSDDVETIKLLVTPINVNLKSNLSREISCLHLAAGYNRILIIDILLLFGADVNAKDEGGLTPLHNAASYGHSEAVKVLLSHGANVNSVDNWAFTPLHEAASKGRDDVSFILLDHHANPNQSNVHNKTVFDVVENPGLRTSLELDFRAICLRTAIQQENLHQVKLLLTSCVTAKAELDLLLWKNPNTGSSLLQVSQIHSPTILEYMISRIKELDAQVKENARNVGLNAGLNLQNRQIHQDQMMNQNQQIRPNTMMNTSQNVQMHAHSPGFYGQNSKTPQIQFQQAQIQSNTLQNHTSPNRITSNHNTPNHTCMTPNHFTHPTQHPTQHLTPHPTPHPTPNHQTPNHISPNYHNILTNQLNRSTPRSNQIMYNQIPRLDLASVHQQDTLQNPALFKHHPTFSEDSDGIGGSPLVSPQVRQAAKQLLKSSRQQIGIMGNLNPQPSTPNVGVFQGVMGSITKAINNCGIRGVLTPLGRKRAEGSDERVLNSGQIRCPSPDTVELNSQDTRFDTPEAQLEMKLLKSAKAGNLQEMKNLIKELPSNAVQVLINCRDLQGRGSTPLHFAAGYRVVLKNVAKMAKAAFFYFL